MVKRCALVLVVALAFARALFPGIASAQEPRDPLIDPPSGGAGSRFQIVGQVGWTPGETVTLRVMFTTSPDPLTVDPADALFAREFTVTVLADGTWSFPIVVDEFFAGFGGPPTTPGSIVVRAESPSHTAVNAFTYTGVGPPPAADGVPPSGFGPQGEPPNVVLMLALFAAGVGALLIVSGAMRRSGVGGN